MNFKGKRALVTGGSRGIGREVALQFARSGAAIAINYVGNQHAAEETAQACRELGANALVCAADVADVAQVHKMFEQIVTGLGGLDILVCNAGTWQGAAVEEMSEESWDGSVATNLKGTWTVIREAVPHMKRQRSGKIVIVSSTAGQRGEAFHSAYAAAKGGQISLTKSLAAELGSFNINVNAVAPGWVDTDMSAAALRDDESLGPILAAIPLGRVATAADIARPIVFLCSDWSRQITGEILNINGGSVLCG